MDRLAEVQAIIQDLEERRLDALFREDEEAFRALFANDALLNNELSVLGELGWDSVPEVQVTVSGLVLDVDDCLVAQVVLDYSASLGPDSVSTGVITLEPTELGWGYSFKSNSDEGWLCEGQHPLES